ncbi:hypothetical protein MMC30_001324 [Trapelia coarctata]|nr:hypothetical protein [Trapelia coarctata]
MAALHEALQGLSPISFDDVPKDESELRDYLQDVFFKGQLLIDSVPSPPPDSAIPASRPRSNTTSSIASNVSEMSSSSARAEALIADHAMLQKEWGKPIKLSAKENPMGIGVYKLSGKDGRAWFARRSVHEGMPYSYWKKALQREFPESLQVQGAPGEGNIRGIGAERKVKKKVVEGVGCVEVYHLSAQFPGPTTPRDFVTLLLTSSAALKKTTSNDTSSDSGHDSELPSFRDVPRHYMVISRPCKHPDCPPRAGFIRGEYESIEFIREVPVTPKKSASTTDLSKMMHSHGGSSSMNKEAVLRHARQRAGNLGMQHAGGSETQLGGIANSEHRPASADYAEGRARGRTISFAESRGITAKGEALDKVYPESDEEDEEINPVEWIMITRSDPGGSVPRWMVERGTPSGIVADASKFIDWACKKGHLGVEEEQVSSEGDIEVKVVDGTDLDTPNTHGQPTGLDGTAETSISTIQPIQPSSSSESTQAPTAQSTGLLSTVASAAYAGFETYAPQSVIDRLPGHHQTPPPSTQLPSSISPETSRETESDATSITSVESFASADSHLSTSSTKSTGNPISSTTSKSETPSPSSDKETARLAARKAKLDEGLRKAREKEIKERGVLTEKETARVKKAEEKHAREVRKAEEKFEKEMKALETRRRKEEEKERKRKEDAEEKERKRKEAEVEKERKRKEAEVEKERKRVEAEAREKARKEKEDLHKQLDGVKKEMDGIKKERDLLENQLGELQKQNTAMVAALGHLEGGDTILKELGVDGKKGDSPGSSSKGSQGR